jgi:hypothetical protein
MKMGNGYTHFAEALIFAHGPQAACEAALHAQLCERSGDAKSAARWHRLQVQVAAFELSSLKCCA